MKRAKLAGFTLIELLVVIAIIAILAAILFPLMANAKERARQIKCLDNLKQLSIAVTQYCDDFDGRLPIARITGVYQEWSGSQGVGQWCYPERGGLYRYVKNVNIYKCPTDSTTSADAITGTIPAGKTKKDYPLSYTMNTDFWGPNRTANAAGNTSVRIQSIVRTKEVLMLIHETHTRINDGDFNWMEGGLNDLPSKVHYEGTTLVYVDTHAAWRSFEQLRKARNEGQWSVNQNRTPPSNQL